MLPAKDIFNFIRRRSKADTPIAFICRMLAFGVIGCHLPARHYKLSKARKQSQFVTCDIMGSKMLLNLNDSGISHDLFLTKSREPYLTSIVQEELHKDDIVIDIGANIGYYALQECNLVKQVYAIEPVPNTIEMLKDSLELNGYKNIELFTIAIGDKNHVSRINVANMSNISSLTTNPDFRTYKTILPVVVRTLDHFIKENNVEPTALRMDVEGYEYEIVKGMTKLLESQKPLKIFMELHLEILKDKSTELLQILKDYGFTVKYACFEPHPAIQNSKCGCWLVDKLYRGMGTRIGHIKVSIDDLMTKDIYKFGQVEYLEVMFER